MNDLAAHPDSEAKLKEMKELLEKSMDEMNDPMTSIAANDGPKSTKKDRKTNEDDH